MQSHEQSPRLASVSVRGLFGIFDHDIPLNTQDRVTIVFGPNGFGKTTILRLVAALFRGQFSRLQRVKFDEFVVRLTTGDEVRVTHRSQGRLIDEPGATDGESSALSVTIRSGGSTEQFDLHLDLGEPRDRERRFLLSSIERHAPVTRMGANTWQHDITGEELTLWDLAERFATELPFLEDLVEVPDPVATFLRRVPVHLIETQRLLLAGVPTTEADRHSRQRLEQRGIAVQRYSAELVGEIQEVLAHSARLSQDLDRTFPQRLLERGLPPEATEERIRERYAVQGRRREQLTGAALLDPAAEVALPPKRLNQAERRVLWVYLDDVEAKLSRFDRLLERIELLKDVINSRFEFKKLDIDGQAGFVFRTETGATVPPEQLSSGEQHELVLTYQLLFRVPDGALVLIDEPEISLHVSWQIKFLDDLARMSQVANLDFLVATHSPQIINNRFDLTVELLRPAG